MARRERNTRSSARAPRSGTAFINARGSLRAPFPAASLACALVIVAATMAVYWNSLKVPYLFDDDPSILNNETIRQLDSLKVLTPPARGQTVTARPLLNVSFAINYALDGLNLWGYHAGNVLIHAAAALALFGLVRRTLLLDALRERWGQSALWIGAAVAAIWALHPLNTSAVTYISQRAESLMALLYLLTLYCFARAVSSACPVPWYTGAVAACWAGMAAKEVMASAPILVLLYDRTLVCGSFKEALRRRWGLYLAMAASWGLLAVLIVSAHGRGGSAGANAGVALLDYYRTQLVAIVRYLKLCFWPAPLVFDYGSGVIKDRVVAVTLCGLLVGVMAALALLGLWRRWATALIGAALFMILAPTSLVPVVTQTTAEHRMYLPLAGIMLLVVMGATRLLGRFAAKEEGTNPRVVKAGAAALVMLVLAGLTFHRNVTYATAESLWRDTAQKVPDNPRAHDNLASALLHQNRLAESESECLAALKSTFAQPQEPAYASAHNNLGVTYLQMGRNADALEPLRKATELLPNSASFRTNYAVALRRNKRLAEAAEQFEHALRIGPNANAWYGLGWVRAEMGQNEQAVACFEKAIALEPDHMLARLALDECLQKLGKFSEAQQALEAAAKVLPKDSRPRERLGSLFLKQGQPREALRQWQLALQINPDNAPLLNQVAWELATSKDPTIRSGPKAVALAQRSIELSQGKEPAPFATLGAALAESGQFDKAVEAAGHARELSLGLSDQHGASVMDIHIASYRAGKPIRQP